MKWLKVNVYLRLNNNGGNGSWGTPKKISETYKVEDKQPKVEKLNTGFGSPDKYWRAITSS